MSAAAGPPRSTARGTRRTRVSSGQNPPIPHRDNRRPHDEVIHQLHVDEPERVAQAQRAHAVCRGWFRVTARVVVGDQDFGGACRDNPFQNLRAVSACRLRTYRDSSCRRARELGRDYINTSDTWPTFRPRGRSRTTISMSLPSRVRQSMSFRSEMPRKCPRSSFESLGCGKPRY